MPRNLWVPTMATAVCAGAVFVLIGCSQPLKTLMALDAEKKSQDVFVDQQDANFVRLLGDARKGFVEIGLSRREIIQRYGPAVLEKEVAPSMTQATVRTLMYRHVTDFLSSPKVYLDFDAADRLVAVRIVEPML